MGGILNRSSSRSAAKPKWKKGKRKQSETMETSTEGDKFLIQNKHEQEQSNGNIINSYEDWNKRLDQQQISNINGNILLS
jgi:hypothetical protein